MRGFHDICTIWPFQCSCGVGVWYTIVQDGVHDGGVHDGGVPGCVALCGGAATTKMLYLLILHYGHGGSGVGGFEHGMLLLALPPGCLFRSPILLLLMLLLHCGHAPVPIWKCLVCILLHLWMYLCMHNKDGVMPGQAEQPRTLA